MCEYVCHEILRRTIISFGTLFNDINIRHSDSSDNTVSEMKVPLAYGPSQKFLARLEQQSNLNKPVQMTLPRMSFEFIGLSYDPTRKVTTTQQFITGTKADKKEARKTYLPVPYNMSFELSVMTKLNDDMLQIVEQILPYFQPAYNLSVNLVETIGEKKISVILDSVTMNDDYEGNSVWLNLCFPFYSKNLPVWSSFFYNKRHHQKVSVSYVAIILVRNRELARAYLYS